MEEEDVYANILEKSENQDTEWALRLNKAITYNFTIPLACIGVGLNFLVIIGWRKSLIKYLALMFRALAWANAYFLISFCTFVVVPSDWIVEVIFRDVAFLSRNIVVHVTLLMSFLFWAALVFPKRFRASSKNLVLHADVALGIIVTYCAVLRFLQNLNKVFPTQPESPWAFSKEGMEYVVLMLPLVLQALLTMHAMLIISRFIQWERQMKLPSELNIMKSSVQKRQQEVVVLIVILSTVTTYAVVVITSTLFKRTPTEASTKHVVIACVNLLVVLNASVNFFIYWGLVPEFRKMVQKRFRGQKTKADQSNLVNPGLQSSTSSSVTEASKAFLTSSDIAAEAGKCPVFKNDSRAVSEGSLARIHFAMDRAQSSATEEPPKTSVSPRPKQKPEPPMPPRMRNSGTLGWTRL